MKRLTDFIFNYFTDMIATVRTSQTLMLIVLAILVGLGGGIGVWLFKLIYNLLQTFMFQTAGGWLAPFGKWTLVLIPVIGGLAVGLFNHYFLKEEKVHGTAAVMQSVALSGGRLPYQSAPAKAAAAALSLGSGASVGPEDPAVQIGANIASMFGQWLRLSDERVKILVAAGAGSAIAAAFNAPIAGVFFALELILGEISGNALWLILVSTVVSAVFTQAVSGNAPAFQVPAYQFHSAWELPLYLLLGMVVGPLSALYADLLYRFQDIYSAWHIADWIKPASAGLILGIAALFIPQVLGTGYSSIEEILNQNGFTLTFLLMLAVAKLILTPLSLGSGFKGGVFAPSLFIGAALGGAFGIAAAHIFPGLGIDPSAFALVGMAAFLAGAVRAPLTAVILLFEMTNDYHIILPLMFSVAVSLVIAQRIQRDSVYGIGLARHGIRLDRGRDVDVLEAITVGEVMLKDTTAIHESDSLKKAADLLEKKRHHGLPVVNARGRLTGVLSLQDIDRAKDLKTKVKEIYTRNLLVVFPDDTLSSALRQMSEHDIGRLPVVSRTDKQKLLGVLRRADVIHAYNLALARRVEQRHHEGSVRLGAMTPDRVDVTDAIVEVGAPIAGKKMKEISFPKECVIASIQRGSKIIIPHGETTVQARDVLVIVAQGKAREEAMKLCRSDK
ncbi:MAG: chloride channel protein [Anaerolineales bacterium]